MALIRTDKSKVDYYGTTLINLDSDTVSGPTDIMVGKIGHINNGQVVDGTATSDATASAADILTGKTAYVYGRKIEGEMPDFTTFPLVCQVIEPYNKTVSEDTDEFTLDPLDLGGRPIKWIGISAASVTLSATSTSAQTRYIISLLYSADRHLIVSGPTDFLGYCIRTGRTSTAAYAYGTSGSGSYFDILHEDLLADGGCVIKSLQPGTCGYFKSGLNYHVCVGG